MTELSRFFKLFPNKRLALDTFSIVESGRVETRIMHEYRGIAQAYRDMRRRTLKLRPAMILLPAREALLEFMVRLSLGQGRGMKIPSKHRKVAREICTITSLIAEPDARVEDAAEATLRIYTRLARIKNDYLEETEFETFDDGSNRSAERSRFKSSKWFQSFQSLGRSRHGKFALTLPSLVGREREYLSPQGVDYRGEFRPELAQLLSRPDANSREQRKSLTAEELADLLRSQRTPKRRDSDEEGEEQDPQTSQMVQNLLRELDQRDPRMQSVTQRPSAQADDDTGPLTATQPNTFIYDEWNVFENGYRSTGAKCTRRSCCPAI